MGKITFILGGARSGKSAYAKELANRQKKKVAFIATCEARDKEMRERIRLHKKNRPLNWKTFEEPLFVSKILKEITNIYEIILIDCLTLLISNLLLKGSKEGCIEREVNKILSTLKKNKNKSIIVSNEVGLGIVPDSRLGREFRDIAGRINQQVAEKSDEVFFVVSGIPWRIK